MLTLILIQGRCSFDHLPDPSSPSIPPSVVGHFISSPTSTVTFDVANATKSSKTPLRAPKHPKWLDEVPRYVSYIGQHQADGHTQYEEGQTSSKSEFKAESLIISPGSDVEKSRLSRGELTLISGSPDCMKEMVRSVSAGRRQEQQLHELREEHRKCNVQLREALRHSQIGQS